MKKFFALFFLFGTVVFAATDTDSDGVSDEKDICPRVYARSESGCPTLAAVTYVSTLNACQEKQVSQGKIIATVSATCDAGAQSCLAITKVTGIQSCDPIFPVILDKTGVPLIRGPIYIVDFTK